MRFRIGRALFPKHTHVRTRRIGLNCFVKACIRNDATEADTLRFIAQHTTIPVPRVQRVFKWGGGTFIQMDFVGGVILDFAWRKWSESTRNRAVEQLRGYISQLRSLQPPSDGIVASVTGGPLLDNGRLGDKAFGPFKNHDDFHQALRAGIPLNEFAALTLDVADIVHAHSREYATKFTHGDLAPRNILVQEDGTVTAIVDWETAGWYPEYWEYTKARFMVEHRDWMAVVGTITGSYQEQLVAEEQLCELVDHT